MSSHLEALTGPPTQSRGALNADRCLSTLGSAHPVLLLEPNSAAAPGCCAAAAPRVSAGGGHHRLYAHADPSSPRVRRGPFKAELSAAAERRSAVRPRVTGPPCPSGAGTSRRRGGRSAPFPRGRPGTAVPVGPRGRGREHRGQRPARPAARLVGPSASLRLLDCRAVMSGPTKEFSI